MFPVIVPPAFGKAAFAVVVVLVNTVSLDAISTPSTVPPTVMLFPTEILLEPSSTIALAAGNVQKTVFVPAPKLTAASLFELDNIVSLESVSVLASVTVPKPTSKSFDPAKVIQ